MTKMILGFILALSVVGTTSYAAVPPPGGAPDLVARVAAPEIDPASAVGALTFLLGGLAVLRSRVKR